MESLLLAWSLETGCPGLRLRTPSRAQERQAAECVRGRRARPQKDFAGSQSTWKLLGSEVDGVDLALPCSQLLCDLGQETHCVWVTIWFLLWLPN